MHDPLDRRVCVVTDRIRRFALARLKLRRIRHELARDRIVRVVRIDQRGDVRGQRDRVTGRNPLKLTEPIRRDQARCQ